MTRDLDTGLLRALIAVARRGSINRAATDLGRTQPALSLQLRKLEQHCGQTLLQRSPRGVSLTAAGQQLLPYAERIVSLTEQMRPSTPVAPASRCRIGLIEDLVSRNLPRVLADFAAARPQLQLDIRVAPGRELSAAFQHEELDLLIASPRVTQLDATPSWVVECSLPWLAQHGTMPAADLIPLILFAAPCSWRDAMLQALETAGRPYRVVLESSSLLAVQAALQAGLGIGALLSDDELPCVAPLPRESLPPLPAVPMALYRRPESLGDPALDQLARLFFLQLSQRTG
ncbi:LysR family transcriptional regulator [Chromobacterium haemolyticum]|uniref:LysR family transcriptional regulator n=1 Tax=Chromobacterium haemolyticum TaxID=394935 RepID=UPI0017473A4B|nr:LysR family transcriptional regulator [Chromobacterium haemolyticum]QOD82799.1 LysR family transcriptional regulator [Chromobacterium haemolyticum]